MTRGQKDGLIPDSASTERFAPVEWKVEHSLRQDGIWITRHLNTTGAAPTARREYCLLLHFAAAAGVFEKGVVAAQGWTVTGVIVDDWESCVN